MNLTIRSATVNDGSAIEKLAKDSLGKSCDACIISERIMKNDRFTYVAEYDDKIIGFIDAEIYSPIYYFDKHMNITGLAVDKAFRRGDCKETNRSTKKILYCKLNTWHKS